MNLRCDVLIFLFIRVGKGIGNVVSAVYPGVEHRECMRHLWKNMKKQYYGPLFAQNMWTATKSFTVDKYNYHMGKIEEKSPKALEYLDEHHSYIWIRSKFSDASKVDYIYNNLSECFNSWVSKTKEMWIVDMHDKIRQKIITKFQIRSKIASKMEGRIITNTIKDLNAKSQAIKDHEVLLHGSSTVEVTVSNFRDGVNLENKTCSSRVWKVTEKPCNHALVVIAKLSREVQMDDFVHE
jgi:hypothetical protein